MAVGGIDKTGEMAESKGTWSTSLGPNVQAILPTPRGTSGVEELHSIDNKPAEVKSYDDFVRTYFNADSSINFPRDAKDGKKSLFSHADAKGLRLKSNLFQEVMQIPEVGENRVAWLLLLSNFVGMNESGSVKTPEWIKVDHQDSAEILADTIEMHMDSIANSHFQGNLNACNTDLQDKAVKLNQAHNLKKLKKEGFGHLSNSQKLFLINELMAEYIYQEGSNQLKEPNYQEFVRKVNFLSTIQTQE